MRGDGSEAQRFYSEAAQLCMEYSYPAQAARLESESTRGPAPATDDPVPVEGWADRSLEQRLADHVPYAVVLRLLGSEATDVYLDFLDRVAAHLEADPGLGYIDGIGADGSIWELSLEGDDPERLWSVVSEMLPAQVLPGSHAEIREGAGTRTVVLGP